MLKAEFHKITIGGFPTIMYGEYCALGSALLRNTNVFGDTEEEKAKGFREACESIISVAFNKDREPLSDEEKQKAISEIETLSKLQDLLDAMKGEVE